jgi:tetratricopeptide (TPR) repeat protein
VGQRGLCNREQAWFGVQRDNNRIALGHPFAQYPPMLVRVSSAWFALPSADGQFRPPLQTLLVCASLALAVLAVYWPLWHCGFVIFDDYDYVVNNQAIQHGLNARSISWAFTTTYAGNWHPLTWISHLLDFQLYGLNPAGHHATSLMLHAANAILLFLLLQRMTRTTWPSAMTAALFALHPMHVESVAWISERKDVLSTFFWTLSVLAYVRYAEEFKVQGSRFKVFYALSLLFYALGLMCKAMLVTLPVILLLLDYWPLERRRPPLRLWAEKFPYFILAAMAGVMTVVAQRQSHFLIPLEHAPMADRLENLPMGCWRYVEKLFWPNRLAVFYPYVLDWPIWEVAGAAAFTALVTVWVIRRARAQPFLAVGWLWFLVGLAPVIGLVQAGSQSMADRYTYLPSVGLFIMVVWSVRECGEKAGRLVAAVLVLAALTGCLYWTPRQVGVWKDSVTLLTHAVDSTSKNYYACTLLGDYLAQNGKETAGIEYLAKAVTMAPSFARAQNDLGHVLLGEGRVDDALPHLQQAAALKPDAPEGHYNLGRALLAKGRVAEALDQFQTQVKLQPEDAIAQLNFGSVLLDNNLTDDAIPPLEKAAAINPSNAEVHFRLGNAYYLKGRAAEAVDQYEKSLQIRPNDAQTCNNLAWILGSSPLTTLRNGPRAVELATRAEQILGGRNAAIAGTLAVAYAESGRFSEAVTVSLRARDLAQEQTNSVLVRLLEERLKLFRAGLPLRDQPLQSSGNAP